MILMVDQIIPESIMQRDNIPKELNQGLLPRIDRRLSFQRRL